MKRLLCVVVIFFLLLTMLPTGTAAAEQTTKEAMTALAQRIYSQCLATSGRESFHGYCGAFVSHQLYNLGINKRLSSRHGNDHFDYYSKLRKTTGGYYITPYFIEEYDLPGALNAVTQGGTKDAYNLAVCFQWTNTEAGGKYGHVMLIYAIIDGIVYFSESFETGINGYCPEGGLVACTMEQFVNAYKSWTIYEGMIEFGRGNYMDSCTQKGTNLMLQSRFDTALRTMPSLYGEGGCEQLRTVSKGERLWAVGIVENVDGQLYYEILEGEQEAYIPATAVGVLGANAQDLSWEAVSLPQSLEQRENAKLSGKVKGKYAQVSTLDLCVYDSEDNLVLREWVDCQGQTASLKELNDYVRLDFLEPGQYLMKVFATTGCPSADYHIYYARACLGGSYLQVGSSQGEETPPQVEGYLVQELDRWVYRNGWYYYQGGEPVTGWLEDWGVRYYLGQDGQAVTGWQELEGNLYYFSQTGAMVKNCQMEKGREVFLLGEDGVAVKAEK